MKRNEVLAILESWTSPAMHQYNMTGYRDAVSSALCSETLSARESQELSLIGSHIQSQRFSTPLINLSIRQFCIIAKLATPAAPAAPAAHDTLFSLPPTAKRLDPSDWIANQTDAFDDACHELPADEFPCGYCGAICMTPAQAEACAESHEASEAAL